MPRQAGLVLSWADRLALRTQDQAQGRRVTKATVLTTGRRQGWPPHNVYVTRVYLALPQEETGIFLATFSIAEPQREPCACPDSPA